MIPLPLSRRRFLTRTAALAALAAVRPEHSLGAAGARAGRSKIPYVDGLSFMPGDPAVLRESGLTGFICDVSAGETVKGADGEQRFVRSFTACARSAARMRMALRDGKYPGAFLATRGSEIAEAHRTGRTAVFFQFQGCEPIEEDLARLDVFFELGLRVLQITHHFDNPSGGGALEPTPRGLTKFGRSVVERMNELTIIPDVAHASDLTALDVVRASRKPVVLSHGSARAIVPNARCASDDVIRAVADSGGVVGIFMMSFWLTNDPRPTVDHVVRQLRHVVKVGGIDAAGIANDYPVTGEANLVAIDNNNAKGIKGYLPWWQSMAKRGLLGFDRTPEHVVIPELNNVRRMFTLHAALDRAGFAPAQVEKIMGGNWMRVLVEVLG